MTGAVTDQLATVAGKVPYARSADINEPVVYTLTHDQVTVSLYANGELIGSDLNEGNTKFFNDIFFGADYDDVAHFKGIMPR